MLYCRGAAGQRFWQRSRFICKITFFKSTINNPQSTILSARPPVVSPPPPVTMHALTSEDCFPACGVRPTMNIFARTFHDPKGAELARRPCHHEWKAGSTWRTHPPVIGVRAKPSNGPCGQEVVLIETARFTAGRFFAAATNDCGTGVRQLAPPGQRGVGDVNFTEGSVMRKLQDCPHCYTFVLPMSSGTCPSCGKNVDQASPNSEFTTTRFDSNRPVPPFCIHCGNDATTEPPHLPGLAPILRGDPDSRMIHLGLHILIGELILPLVRRWIRIGR